MKARSLVEEDYKTVCEWWKSWNWPVLPKSALPDNGKGGFMVEKNGELIVCGFLYLTNSKWALLEWIVSNPKYRQADRKDAIELLVKNAEIVCKKIGVEFVFSIARHEGLIQTHKKLGWNVEEKPSYEMTKKIN